MAQPAEIIDAKDIKIDKEDLVAVGIVEYEDRLEAAIKAHAAKMEAFNQEFEKAQERFQSAMRSFAKKAGQKIGQEFVEKASAITSAKWRLQEGTASARVEKVNKKYVMTLYFGVFQEHEERNSYNATAIRVIPSEIPASLTAESDKIQELEKERDRLNAYDQELKQAKADLKKAERRMRAGLARRSLSSSAEGKAILATLTSTMFVPLLEKKG